MEEPENGARKLSGNGARKLSGNGAKKLSGNGVRNGSATRAPGNPSPTRSSAREQSKPSGSPEPPRIPKWLILDRFAHRSRKRRCGVVEDDATASELAFDCAGRPVRASLRIADPPAVSRLYLHQTGRPEINFREPTAIAAHRNSILFRMIVPFEDPEWWRDTYSFPIDYFVYSCRSSSSSPQSLTLLPPCFDGGYNDPEFDELCKPRRQQQQRLMFPRDLGILCHSDEFTVAHVRFSEPYQFELCLLHSPPTGSGISMEWSVKKEQIPPDTKINTHLWMTDAVLPIGRCLCWVDNYQGMLVVDVVTDSNSNPDHQQWFRYIPMPKDAKGTRRYIDKGEPDPMRSVCVTNAGIIKLVCIVTKCPFTIQGWTLNDVRKGTWKMDPKITMDAEWFFRLLGAAGLPRLQPSFPLVSLVDADVICFLLEDKDRHLFWMIDVDMKNNKKLLSSALYISEEEEEDGYPPKRSPRYYFYGHRFIPSEFSSYLSEDAITSRDLSEKMQKTKVKTVMQKSGLQHE